MRQKINNIILPMQFQIRLPLQNSTWYSHICMYNQFDIVYTYILQQVVLATEERCSYPI